MMAGRSGSCPQQPSLITSRGNCDPAVIHRHRCMSRDAGIVFRNWSGARDLNPGPHGPEIYAVSSTEIGFAWFGYVSTTQQPIPRSMQPLGLPGLLHELLQKTLSTDADTWISRVLNARRQSLGWKDSSSSSQKELQCALRRDGSVNPRRDLPPPAVRLGCRPLHYEPDHQSKGRQRTLCSRHEMCQRTQSN
jgi:hypothetical protein